MKYEISPIAIIRTPFQERFGTPRQPGLVQSAVGEVEFCEDYSDPLFGKGLEGFSHVWLTFLFDRVREQGFRKQVRPPRLGGNEKVGVFASRSPFRPNHLGLSVVKLEEVIEIAGQLRLRVSGVDLCDKTPIVDVRPYVPYTDSISDARGGFATSGKPDRLKVALSEDLQKRWRGIDIETRTLIEETLSCDPVPAYQLDSERLYKVEIAGFHIEWKRSEEGVLLCQLDQIED